VNACIHRWRVNHIAECEACKAEPYAVCGEGLRLWRGDSVEMDAVNERIQLMKKMQKALRNLTNVLENQLDNQTDWPEEIGVGGASQ
jgi:hypothetical protein